MREERGKKMQERKTTLNPISILEKIEKAVIPVILPKEQYSFEDDIVTESFEDMVFGYHLTTVGQNKIYVKTGLETILSESGFNLKGAALKNYDRNLKVHVSDCIIPICIKKMEITVLIGNLNLEPVLLCQDALKKLGELCGGNYDILGVASVGMVVRKSNSEIEVTRQCRDVVDKILGKKSSTGYVHHYDTLSGKLEKKLPDEDCYCDCTSKQMDSMPILSPHIDGKCNDFRKI